MITNEKNVFIPVQNSVLCSKALLFLNCLNTFVHDCPSEDKLVLNFIVFRVFFSWQASDVSIKIFCHDIKGGK